MHVATVLKRKGNAVVTIAPDATVGEAVAVLTANRIGAAVVVDGTGAVSGIISERDVIRGIATEGRACLDRPVSHIMTRDVVECRLEDTIAGIMAVMTNHRIRHVPVVHAGKLIGIISIGDVVKHRLDEAELEVAELREYVGGRG